MTTVLTKACPYVHTTSAIYKSCGIYLRLVTSALMSYPDPNSQVFRILMSQLGSL
jgi:hypothetical protein